MDLIYNIDFELVGVLYVLVIYAASSISYSNQSEVNKKFKLLVKCVLVTEIIDLLTAITISYGSVVPPWLNILANTVYFVLTFSLGYCFLRYVESYVNQSASRLKSIRVNKMLYMVPLYYAFFSSVVLIKNQSFFKTKQKLSISVYIIMCLLGPILQMLLFQNVLLSVFTLSIALLIILFSMETPDYQLLMKTLAELDALRKNLQVEVKKQTKKAEEKKWNGCLSRSS